MKRWLLTVALATTAVAVMAQQSELRGQKYSVMTNSFWKNWFAEGHVTWNAFYASDVTGRHNSVLSAPFRKFPIGEGYTSLGLSVALGKWFTPGIGLRTKVQAWTFGSKVTVNGIDVKSDKFWTLNEQVLLNLTILFKGYDPERRWNLIPYFGGGVNRDATHNHYATQLSFGLLNTYRLTEKFSVCVDLGWNSFEKANQGLALNQRRHQFSFEVGVVYSLGRSGWSKSPDLEALRDMEENQLDALNAQLADEQAENERLQEEVDRLQEELDKCQGHTTGQQADNGQE